jgi:hypothetical protein
MLLEILTCNYSASSAKRSAQSIADGHTTRLLNNAIGGKKSGEIVPSDRQLILKF